MRSVARLEAAFELYPAAGHENGNKFNRRPAGTEFSRTAIERDERRLSDDTSKAVLLQRFQEFSGCGRQFFLTIRCELRPLEAELVQLVTIDLDDLQVNR